MAVTISQMITILDRHTGDTSTNRFSTNDRYDALTEACVWLQGKHQSELQNFTYKVNFLDTINYYNTTTIISDLLMASDMRRLVGDNSRVFTFKDSKRLAEDISNGSSEDAYTIERYDKKSFVGINTTSKYPALKISSFESLTDGGTWTADTSSSDATNLTLDQYGAIEGNGCLNFDIDVSQSGNNRARIYAEDLDSIDMSSIEGLSSGILKVYLPAVTYFSSVTLYWGTDASNYWSATVSSPIDPTSWTVGWNEVKVDWSPSTTVTGTPDSSDINYVAIDFNYTASQADQTDYRIDFLRFARPEVLTFHYLSANVGFNTSGTGIALFSAGTDVPYFSGQYDNLKYAITHYASGILLQDARLFGEANQQFDSADQRLKEAKDIFPSSRQRETKSFKVSGINFRRK